MNKDKYSIDEPVVRLMPEGALEGDERYEGGTLVTPQRAEIEEYEVGEAPTQTEEIKRRYGDRTLTVKEYDTLKADFNKEKEFFSGQYSKYSSAPTTILSRAIEQVEQLGNYKVMMALVDLDKSKPKEDRLYTFTDIESKKLREVIYKKMEEGI